MSTFLLITREVSYMYAHLNVGLQTPGILTGWSLFLDLHSGVPHIVSRELGAQN